MKQHSIDSQTAAAPNAIKAPAERKDLLPWPIKTRKRGSGSNASTTWSFMDLPPKKRILLAAQARRVDRFVCVICGRVFEDYQAFGGHKSHHRNEDFPELGRLWRCCGGERRHRKVMRDFDINELPRSDGEDETLDPYRD